MALDPDARELQDVLIDQPLDLDDLETTRTLFSSAPTPPAPEIEVVQDATARGPYGDIPLRLYRPTAGSASPAVVWLHGGGFAIGDLDSHDAWCHHLAAASDCVVIAVDYRLAPEHKFPVPGEDCFAAVEWVHAHAAELGIDAARIAIGGDSAGATLATVVAQMLRDRKSDAVVQQQILAYPTVYLRVSNPEYSTGFLSASVCEQFWQLYIGRDADRLDRYCAPSNAGDLGGLPPAFVLTAEEDPTRDDAERYGAQLSAAGVRATVKRYPGTFHGFLTMQGVLGRASEALDDVARAVRSELGAPAATPATV
ncbi:alpha/beta hydrolase [Gordonia terrae]|uniref:alpha/beta hydrolase n=1 Tax=Gordonia terrae TaxID=2055 RepID=UPI003F6BB44B